MKTIFATFLVLVFTCAFATAQVTLNQTDALGHKQGLWEEKSPSGLSKGNYTNDLKDGCWATYSGDGKLMRIENFSKGIPNGLFVEIDPRAGYLTGESFYVNGMLEGTVKKFFYGTNPASLIEYAHGKINGKKKVYYENAVGKIMEESDYKDDMKNGPSNFYNMAGELVAEYNYADNMLQGVQKMYYPGKKLMSEQEYAADLEQGFWKEYYENGNLKTEGNYVKGILNGPWKEYSEDGKLKQQGNYLNGEKTGKWQEFDASGKVVKTTTYNKGQAK